MAQETLLFWIKTFSQVFAHRLHILQHTVSQMTAVALTPIHIHTFLQVFGLREIKVFVQTLNKCFTSGWFWCFSMVPNFQGWYYWLEPLGTSRVIVIPRPVSTEVIAILLLIAAGSQSSPCDLFIYVQISTGATAIKNLILSYFNSLTLKNLLFNELI